MSFLKKILKTIRFASIFFLMHLYCELIVYDSINPKDRDFSIFIVLYLIPIALFEAALLHLFKNKTLGKIVCCVISLLITAYYVIQYVYFRTFGSLITVSTIGLGGNALKDFGWTLKGVLVDNAFEIFLLFVPLLIVLGFTVFYKKIDLSGFGFLHFLCVAIVAVLVWIAITATLPLFGEGDHTVYGAYHSQFVDTDTASKKLGAFADTIVETRMRFFGSSDSDFEENLPEVIEEPSVDTSPNIIPGLSIYNLSKTVENKDIKKICEYLSTDMGTMKNEYTGLLKDYNLIYICAESFSTAAIDKDVTPTLYRLAHGGVILNNYYNSFPNTTTNGEYAFLTGLWPDVSRSAMLGKLNGSMPSSSNINMEASLGNMINNARSTKSLGYHNFLGYYYGREDSLPNMGFKCKFMNDGMTFTTSWPSSDLEMMQQSVSDYVNSDDPFCVYYMTFSGHGSYLEGNVIYDKNIEEVDSLVEGRHLAKTAKGYFACNMELDKGLEYLLSELEKAGKINNTLIVIAGDHYPYYLSDLAYTQLNGVEEKDENFGMFKSSCIMWAGSLEENPIVTDNYCCNVDILPTVLNLLGITYDSRLYAGRDILSNTRHMAILYNKNFITDELMYNNETGEATWLVDEDSLTPEYKEGYLKSCINTVKNRYQVSVSIPSCDFYQFIFDNIDRDVLLEKRTEPIIETGSAIKND